MGRKSPVEHGVKTHERRGKKVDNFRRGKGSRSQTVKTTGSSAEILKAKQKDFTIDEHRRKLKKIGDQISYLDNGKRVNGDVVGIRAEYYLVERNGKVWKVDRHSIFTRIGSALKGAHAATLVAGREGVAASKKSLVKITMKLSEVKNKLVDAKEKRNETQIKNLEKISLKLNNDKIFKENEELNREAERINWRDWKSDMEKEEKINLEINKSEIRAENERKKFRKRISEGPLWKRAFRKVGKEIVKRSKKEIDQRKEAKKKTGSKKKSSKSKSKTITIKVS